MTNLLWTLTPKERKDYYMYNRILMYCGEASMSILDLNTKLKLTTNTLHYKCKFLEDIGYLSVKRQVHGAFNRPMLVYTTIRPVMTLEDYIGRVLILKKDRTRTCSPVAEHKSPVARKLDMAEIARKQVETARLTRLERKKGL